MGTMDAQSLVDFLTKHGDKLTAKEAEEFIKSFVPGDNKIDIESNLIINIHMFRGLIESLQNIFFS